MLNVMKLLSFIVALTIVATTATAKKTIERSFFQKPIEAVKKLGISAVVASTIAISGCSSYTCYPPSSLSSHSVSHPETEIRNGLVLHAHKDNAYKRHGKHLYYGLATSSEDADAMDFQFNIASDFNNVILLYENNEIGYGLAIANETSDDTLNVLSPTNHDTSLVNVNDLEGILFIHHPLYEISDQNQKLIVHNDDILTEVDSLPHENTFYTGRLGGIFSNGLWVLHLGSFTYNGKKNYLEKWHRVIVSEDYIEKVMKDRNSVGYYSKGLPISYSWPIPMRLH